MEGDDQDFDFEIFCAALRAADPRRMPPEAPKLPMLLPDTVFCRPGKGMSWCVGRVVASLGAALAAARSSRMVARWGSVVWARGAWA